MLIEILATSTRGTRCRRCGSKITYAELVATGRVVAFDGPLVRLPALSLFPGRDVVAIDTNTNHAHACPPRRHV